MGEKPVLRRFDEAGGDASHSAPRRSGGQRALIVDDDPIARNIVRDLLKSRSFEVDGAESAQAALQRVRVQSYEILILDIFLPDSDGRLLHGSIAKIDPALADRTVFISNSAPTGAIADYIEKHGVFIKKPFTAEDLMRGILAMVG